MGLYHASSSVARYCPTRCPNTIARQSLFRSISDYTVYPFSRRTPYVTQRLSGQRISWTWASSLSLASNWRRLPCIVRPFSMYERSKDHFQILEKEREQKREAQIKQLAVRTCTFSDARSPSRIRRAVKPRRLDPPCTNKSRPPINYPWVAEFIQASKDTAHVIFKSRNLIFGFTFVFSLSWLLFNIEMTYNASNYSRKAEYEASILATEL